MAAKRTQATKQPDDAAGKPPTPPPVARRRIRLSDIRAVRRELCATYSAFVSGSIDRAQATARTFMLSTLAHVIADAELEQRIERLEQAQQGKP